MDNSKSQKNLFFQPLQETTSHKPIKTHFSNSLLGSQQKNKNILYYAKNHDISKESGNRNDSQGKIKSLKLTSTLFKSEQQSKERNQHQFNTFHQNAYSTKEDVISQESNSMSNLDYMIQSRPITKQENIRAKIQEYKIQTQHTQINQQRVQTPSSNNRGNLLSPKSQNVLDYRNIVRNKVQPSGRTIANESDKFGLESAKLFKQLDIPIDNQQSLKQLKEYFIQSINNYNHVVKDYAHKIQTLGVLLSKIEFQENFRSIQDLQELFHFCRDKIQLTDKHVQIEQLYFQNKRLLELKNVELSSFKAKCKKQEEILKKIEDENRDLRKQVFNGIEERTALFKHSQTDQAKISSMVVKVDGLEQGLLALSDKSGNNEELRQNRLKTTIHMLISENNTLKKELSYMKNQNDEQIEEINRLKKKINHLVMKIDEQNRKFAMQNKNNPGYLELINVQEKEILQEDHELDHSGLEEFEKLQEKLNKVEEKAQTENQSPTLVLDSREASPVPKKSSFNLQGPYWKNRTNDILKQDRDKRKLLKHESVDQNRALQIPSLLTRDGRERRHSYDFRFDFLNVEETGILKEINHMGIHNYVETTMSLKSLDIKKNIELVTREYIINNTVRRIYEFLVGVMIEYFLQGGTDSSKLINRINQGMLKILNVKDFRVWIRDVMNNYLWTYSSDQIYEIFDLTQSNQGQSIINLKETTFMNFRGEDNCLITPLFNVNNDQNVGLVQLIGKEDNLTQLTDIQKIHYENQIGTTLVSEIVTALLSRELQNKVQYYFIGKQTQVQKTLLNFLNQKTKFDLYNAFEKDIKLVFETTKVRFAFVENNMIWNYHKDEMGLVQFQEFNIQEIQSLMTITISKNQCLIFFMPYQNMNFDQRLDMETTMPLNSILIKSSSGKVVGVLQFENKLVKNRNISDNKLQNQMVTSLSDEGIISVIRQMSDILLYRLEYIEKHQSTTQ
ncbi:UNKNOWN [Stylonychia lemnae]|uniref:GAF domain-containing protein n=1 Tax=Stylonychia lemnae TaxID=5949 RepID=A0A077ZZV1_STYLE|nr:UNKNOWN [Stylonychia lemnae]|eukprot:CDW74048.1 UNKNOWN [Stylonychia lemnae]